MSPEKRRTLKPSDVAEQQRGSRRLGPGAWVDKDGGLHFSVPELLAVFSWPDDAEHRGLVNQMIREVMAREAPRCEIIEQEEES